MARIEGSVLGMGRSLQDTYPNAATKPSSGLESAISSALFNNARANEALGRLRILADLVGGAVPAGAASATEKSPMPLGSIGKLGEANATMGSVLGLIEEEIGRLEGLVG